MRWLGRAAEPIRQLLVGGLSVDKIALCIACGVTLAVFPVIGATTLLCTAAALLLGLNLPAIQAVNYLAYPLQLALLLPLIRGGELLLGTPPLPFSVAQMIEMVRDDAGQAIAVLWSSTLGAVAAWLLLAPFLFAGLYFGSRPVLERMALLRAQRALSTGPGAEPR